ncbi:hypothetical protein R69927_04092 [Paraburkholderia domus]|nr:hypothetical protein R70006_04204 [Paraburkholderia domus]CAE6784358.1 hypothetical protein R75483_04598 [Paraburkholderia domus]CAE6878585.1 hypothetical protein R69927_04092 [Paraburkholderia domus]CAE6892680.1 hypothetical protein R69749_07699 [Paraburkholderia domus]
MLTEASTGELRWLHAELGATMPYRQAKAVMDLLLPTSGSDNHVTIRNHTVAIGKSIQHARPVRPWCETEKPIAELGIDVGYVRRARCNRKGSGKENRSEAGNWSSSIAVVDVALGQAGEQPRVWASATTFESGAQRPGSSLQLDSLTCLIYVRHEIRQ